MNKFGSLILTSLPSKIYPISSRAFQNQATCIQPADFGSQKFQVAKTRNPLVRSRTAPKSMKAYLQILGVDSGDSFAGMLLFFDDERYLFECGDGTQRLAAEYRVKIATPKLKNVFLTTCNASSIGGLFGMILTIADAGKNELKISAPAGLRNMMSAATPFVYRPQLSMEITEISDYDPSEQVVMVGSLGDHENNNNNLVGNIVGTSQQSVEKKAHLVCDDKLLRVEAVIVRPKRASPQQQTEDTRYDSLIAAEKDALIIMADDLGSMEQLSAPCCSSDHDAARSEHLGQPLPYPPVFPPPYSITPSMGSGQQRKY